MDAISRESKTRSVRSVTFLNVASLLVSFAKSNSDGANGVSASQIAPYSA